MSSISGNATEPAPKPVAIQEPGGVSFDVVRGEEVSYPVTYKNIDSRRAQVTVTVTSSSNVENVSILFPNGSNTIYIGANGQYDATVKFRAVSTGAFDLQFSATAVEA